MISRRPQFIQFSCRTNGPFHIARRQSVTQKVDLNTAAHLRLWVRMQNKYKVDPKFKKILIKHVTIISEGQYCDSNVYCPPQNVTERKVTHKVLWNECGGDVAAFSVQVTAEQTGFICWVVNRPLPRPTPLRLLLTHLQLSWTVCSEKAQETQGKVNGARQLVQMAPWAGLQKHLFEMTESLENTTD